MRSGTNCTVQQTLATEAASVLKHSLNLARRRGHAQVTPLHVAATLLSLRTSLLKRACFKSQTQVAANSSHQYPLQCRALELCFNVALNRLPTTPGPLLHGQPSLSNALIAALKRAQAHQRRGCIEQQQQQPLLTIKVELEQLIISILDDPGVSRVMREAGFSSTVVKNNIEDSSASSVFQCYSVSGGVISSPCSPSPTETHREIFSPATFLQTHFFPTPVFFSPQNKVPASYLTDSASVMEDIKLVLEVLLGKKRKNTVIVGDCVSITEGLVGELIGRVERGEVPMELKQTQFIKFQFAPVSLSFMRKEEVEMNVSELRRMVDSLKESGVIIYTGDLKWTVEESSNANGGASTGGYCSPLDHLVTELGKLLSDYGNSNSRVWLMATASYQTYMRCQMRQPPLEVQWALQAVSVPSGGLGLSLQAPSNHHSRINFSQNPSQVLESKPFIVRYTEEEQDKITCCPECTSNYEKEVQLFKSDQKNHLPPWLQPEGTNTNQKVTKMDELAELKRKWNKTCLILNHHATLSLGQGHFVSTLYNNHSLRGKSNSQASPDQWCPTPAQSSFLPGSNTISFTELTAKPNHVSNGIPKFRRQNTGNIDFNFSNGNAEHQPGELSLGSLKKYTEGKEEKISLSLGSSFVSETGELEKGTGDFCRLLKGKVPWQSAIITTMAEALTDSKFGKKETWLLIQGSDIIGKRRLALALAELLRGSPDSLLHLNNKRRVNEVTTCTERLARALRSKEGLVVLVEDVDLADTRFLKFLTDQFEAGRYANSTQTRQAIFILTKGDSTSYEDGRRNNERVIQMTLKVNEEAKVASNGSSGIDHKRKAERDIASKIKAPKLGAREDACQMVPVENGISKRCFSRQSSFNTLDLNIKADEDEESEGKAGEFSPISSDLTCDTSSDPLSPHAFLDAIKNRFVFHRTEAQEIEMKDFFLQQVKRGFKEAVGDPKVAAGFRIDERVIQGVVDGFGSFVNSQFEKWLKEVLQTSLQTVKHSGKGRGIDDVTLCFGGESDRVLEDGFMGTYLPNKIQVSFMD